MKNRSIFLFFVVLVFLVQQAFAQFSYTESGSVVCGNSVCERALVEINIGEEKNIDIGGKLHTFKLDRIEKVGDGGYNFYLSVDRSPPMISWEAEKSLNNIFSSSISIGPIAKPGQPIVIKEAAPGTSHPEPDRAVIYLYEDRFCAVPDCAFKAELSVYKKWNLVPLYFLQGWMTESSYVENTLKKGTCNLKDFTVIYGYNPIKKENIKLYSWGRSINDLQSAFSAFSSTEEAQNVAYPVGSEPPPPTGILIGTPFNSVWVYSNNECKLVAEIPHQFKDLLLILAAAGEDKTETISVPHQKGQPAPPMQTRTTPGIKFAPGWNFFAGSPDMEGKSLDEIRGSCTIEKASTFDANSQSWKPLTTGVGISNNFAFKVTNKCMLGMPQVAPPEIPA